MAVKLVQHGGDKEPYTARKRGLVKPHKAWHPGRGRGVIGDIVGDHPVLIRPHIDLLYFST
jgi:hypothetical protein